MLGLSRHWSVTRIDNIQPDSATQIASERHKITNICETFIFLSVLTYAVLRILDSTAKKVVDRETPLQSSDNHTTRMKR